MKKSVRILAIVLCLIMGLACMPSNNLSGKVNASYYYLNHSWVQVVAGQTTKLKVQGTSRSAKWSSSNKRIATVKNGKVKGVRPGEAYIYAKIGGQKLSCKVSVSVNSEKALSKVTYEYTKLSTGILATIKNGNDYAINYTGTMVFYDGGGAMMSTSSNYASCFGAGQTICLFYRNTRNDFATYKISQAAAKDCYFQDAKKKVSWTANVGSNGRVIAEVKNTGKKEVRVSDIGIIYYDASHNPIGYATGLSATSKLGAGEKGYWEFSQPRDSSYNSLAYDTYQIIVNSAYYHNP